MSVVLNVSEYEYLGVHFFIIKRYKLRKLCEKHQYAKYFKFMENQKYFSEGENNNLKNISAI